MEEIQGDLVTTETLLEDLEQLGIRPGMTLLVHSSMKALGGWVAGGPAAVILALEAALGPSGTLIMPTHTGELTDPAGWRCPPVREAWWDPIRRTMPPYDPDLSLTYKMGAIPECFRKQKGVLRSSHPHLSFAAWGRHAADVTGRHSLDYGLGEDSPLARMYDLGGHILLLGVGHGNNTSLHLAEARSRYRATALVHNKAPMLVNGIRQWVTFLDVDWDPSDFEALGSDYERAGGIIHKGRIAHAPAQLLPQRPLVDYAVEWMNVNRSGPVD